jgi:thioredoxin-like negative regulator of GroEL
MDRIEALLAEEPTDSFLCYGLAMEHASAGNPEHAAELLQQLISRTRTTAESYIPAYLQRGQILARLGKDQEAVATLREGIDEARRVGDHHALGEMQGLLATLD